MKAGMPQTDYDIEALLARVARLEQGVMAGAPAVVFEPQQQEQKIAEVEIAEI
jgi:hypothetical protein